MGHYANNSACQFPSEEDLGGGEENLDVKPPSSSQSLTPGGSHRLSLFTPAADLRAGMKGVAELTLQMKALRAREAEGLAQHHLRLGPRHKLRVSH